MNEQEQAIENSEYLSLFHFLNEDTDSLYLWETA